MSWMRSVLTLAFAVAAFGCASDDTIVFDESAMDRATIESLLVQATDNGIVRQNTVYPYHFLAGTDELTPLGHRCVETLANHYRHRGGSVQVVRNGTSEDLYQARVAAILNVMSVVGVASQVKVTEDMPGGDGLTSDHILTVEQERRSES
jgi:hypothetical protein